MTKEFQAGYYKIEVTDIIEKRYCKCFIPIRIDRWFDRVQMQSEYNALLMQIYRKIGHIEGMVALLNCEEVKNINSLIDRVNLMYCQPDGKRALDILNFFSQIHEDESMIQSLKDQIALYSDINVLKSRHRKKFVILRNAISALREEFNPVSPERIGESIDDLLDVTSKYANYFKKQNDVLNPILFSGLLLYQLLTLAPYEQNNIVHSSYAVAKYMRKLKVLPEVSLPLAKLIQNNINECEDRMAEVRWSCNINLWLTFYLNIMDKALEAVCRFIQEQQKHMETSINAVNRVKNISPNMRNKMIMELGFMQQMPFFRIEDVMNHCNITHSTAVKMVNTFIKLKIVKQADNKQRYRVYEYVSLTECIKKI